MLYFGDYKMLYVIFIKHDSMKREHIQALYAKISQTSFGILCH